MLPPKPEQEQVVRHIESETLGLNTEKTAPLFKKLGWAYALLIFAGNAAIVLSIWLFGYGR